MFFTYRYEYETVYLRYESIIAVAMSRTDDSDDGPQQVTITLKTGEKVIAVLDAGKVKQLTERLNPTPKVAVSV